VCFGANDDVDDRAIEKVRIRKELSAHSTLVQLPTLGELVLQHIEEVVLLNPLYNLLLIVKRDVGRDRSGETLSFDLLFIGQGLFSFRLCFSRERDVTARDSHRIQSQLSAQVGEDASQINRWRQMIVPVGLDIF
jgi:hypothetical protein